MKSSEKQLVGIAILAAGIYVVFSFGLPQWDAFTANNAKSAELRNDLKSSQDQRDSLNLQISLLQKNIDIPVGIQVKTFTNDTEVQATKELLDHVVNLATGSGNKFISLSPATVEPFLASPTPKSQNPNAAANTAPASTTPPPPGAVSTDGNAGDSAEALARAQESLPTLVTKGYSLTVRGTYATLQAFLRAMDQQAIVMDMLNLDLENEAGDTTGGNVGSTLDPSFPLRLKVTLRLALQRVESGK